MGLMPWTSLPFPETLDLTPGPDGFRLWFDGAVITEFKTESNAARGLTWAREAIAMLSACLAKTNSSS
jgi:hypothetical protein